MALDQGMSLVRLFSQLENIRQRTSVPLVLMGYLNPVLQFGLKRFCQRCREVGVDGLILPDMPMDRVRARISTLATRKAAGRTTMGPG